MSIYCISIFDGIKNKAYSYYITDYKSLEDLISAVLSVLLSREFTQRTVYIHNSSNFDLVFLLKYIVNHPGVHVDPTIKDGNFINLKIHYGPNLTYNLNFKDSFLLLPSSLSKLSKQFQVETLKSIFPHKFVNKENLNYVGPVPSFNYFDGISDTEYKDYCKTFNNNWNLKNEAIKYCEIDCIALYKVVETFSKLIFEKFNVNISSVSTLPSLAFKIFRTRFLPKNIKLPVLTGKIYSDIAQAYYGGHVDMYIPTNPEGEEVYNYDVNSLYPFVMKTFIYPSNIIAYFRGNILKMDSYKHLFDKYLSVVKVRVTAPSGLLHPILPYKVDGITIYPEGSWTGWYYIEEVRNAMKYGYKFEILEGYLFEGCEILSAFVQSMYSIKELSHPTSPMYLISKLLMNSLYGRFGMKLSILTHEVVDNSKISKLIAQIGLDNIVDQVLLGDKTILSSHLDFPKIPKINISIASAIAANARVYMSLFKNHPDFILYYTDTDSIFLNKRLPAEFESTKQLGLFKLEKVLRKFVALGPKVYGGVDRDGLEFTKVKGLKTKVTVAQLEELLRENNSINVSQVKWFNQITNSTISVKDSSYNLTPNNNKRNLIYKNGVLVGTSNKAINE
uniref:DNA polymerase n=2 Tax=Hymenochaetaceae TaxID=40424 RepID=UPI00233E9AB2|nr:DNA polymerase [Phellinus igniarius]WBU93175.1 DNA polymerase [Phellinus igniarius]